MEKLIACCGLNCDACDARIATLQDSDELRKATAETWKKMYNAPEIPFEAINCTGCRMEGVKFTHCESTCDIRKCVRSKGFATCADCAELEVCTIVGPILAGVPDARENLRSLMN